MTRLVKTRENISGLPNGFTEVEYLEGTGTQYIDIGLKGKNNLDFEYKCEFTNLDGTAQCVGGNWSGQGSSTVSMYFGLIRTNGNFAYHYDGTSSPVVVMSTTVQGTPYSVQGHLWKGEQYFVINGTKSSVGTIASEFTSSLNMYLFGINNNGLANPAYIKLHCFKLWDNGVLVRDFIPCLDNNSKPCMYDLVGKKVYYNQGTGEFTYGRTIQQVSYLESSGTQYIDTGYVPSNTTGVQIEHTICADNSHDNIVFGCRQNSGNTRFWEDVDWGGADNIGWGFNEYSNNISGYRCPLTSDMIGQTIISSFNFMNDRACKVDGVSYDPSITTKTLATITKPMYLFGANNQGNFGYANACKVFYMNVSENQKVVMKLVPAIDSNNVGFMFDRVTHTIFDNAGTGSFSYGNPAYTTMTRLVKEPLLPNGFKRVEYLASSGTQYIDTGIYPTQLTKAEYRCAVTGSVANVDSHLFGSRLSASSEAFDLAYMNTTPNGIEKFRFIHGTTTTQETTTSVTASQLASPHTYYMSGTSFKVDGSEKMSFTTASFTGSYSLWLFGVNSAGSLHNQVRAQRVYKCIIWDNGTLVRDFIPALDTTNTPCMYDTVTQTPFYNQGSGSFTYGNILPYETKTRLIPSWLDDYTFVNYIQSTGTQYINTGVTLTNNHSVEIDYQLTQASQSRAGLFGNLNMTGSNQGRFGSLLSPSNQQLEHGYGTGNDYWQQGSPDTNRHKLYQKKNEIYFDGTLIHTFTSATFTLNTTAPLGSFGYTNYTPAKAKYYNSKWWNGDTLIRNFIPAIRKSDNAVGMLDIVNRVFYTNQGTGVFSYG